MRSLGMIFLVLTMIETGSKNIFVKSARNQACVKKRIVDLTHPFNRQTMGYPGLRPFTLNITHRGLADAGFWLQVEEYGGATHVGTHIDAPCHIMKGKWRLDQIPLKRFIAPAAMVDISHRAGRDRNTNLTVEDLMKWEERNGCTLDHTIVLVNTGWSNKWSDKNDFLGTNNGDAGQLSFPGISPEAAKWIRRHRRIYGIGIDTTSLDNGQAVQRKAHEELFRANIYGMENVAIPEKFPEYGAMLYVFPMRIDPACGGPVRVMAELP